MDRAVCTSLPGASPETEVPIQRPAVLVRFGGLRYHIGPDARSQIYGDGRPRSFVNDDSFIWATLEPDEVHRYVYIEGK
jgi:hypothetical protein